MKNNNPIILVAGFSGINVFGEYLSHGSSSPSVPPGIHAGEWSREICFRVSQSLNDRGVRCQIVNPGPINTPRKNIASYLNDTVKRCGNALVLEVTCSKAIGDTWSNECGYSIHTSFLPCSVSRLMSQSVSINLKKNGYKIKTKEICCSDDILMSRSNFPIVSFSAGYVSNIFDCECMTTPSEKEKIINSIVDAMELCSKKMTNER